MKKKNRERGNFQVRKGILWLGAVFTAVKIMVVIAILSGCTKAVFDYSTSTDTLDDTGIDEVFPANAADNVEVNPVIGVTFNSAASFSEIAATSLSVKDGSASVPGTVAVSGKSALFSYAGDLKPMTEYTATIRTSQGSGSSQDKQVEYSWKFKTGKNRRDNSLAVVSVSPADKNADVALTSQVSIIVDKEIQSWMKGLINVKLTGDSKAIEGDLLFSGNTVTFYPVSDLVPNTLYSCTFNYKIVGTANSYSHDDGDDEEDEEGVNSITKQTTISFSWTFTTTGTGAPAVNPDNIRPSITSVVPAANAVSIATNSKVVVTFSEAMNAATITTSTFILKQGSTSVQGTVSYSGNVATFTPSSVLAGGVTYTATLSAGIKDAAGNQLANEYTWSFTTGGGSTGMSFASDVIPVLNQCNNCHTHPWTTSSVASTYYTNLVNGGYINQSSPTSSLIYTKLSGGHASSISSTDRNKILTWIKEGAKNN